MLYIPRTLRLQAAEEYFRIDNSWDESKHPRDERGRFSHINRQKDCRNYYNTRNCQNIRKIIHKLITSEKIIFAITLDYKF